MKRIYFCLAVCIFELISFSLNAQKWTIVGRNKDNLDGFAIVCTEDVTVSDIVYITENEYNNATNVFVDAVESITKYTPPAGGHSAGEVITIRETASSSNTPEIVGCSSGNCGTVSNVGGTFAIGTSNDELYAYADNDDTPVNGVTEIYCVWWWNGSVSAGEDPTGDYPNAISIEFIGDISSIDYNVGLRSSFVSKSDFENTSNYTTNGTNTTLSTIPFTGGLLPVELTYFSGEQRSTQIELNWITYSELNNEKFEIQESQYGREFQKIGEVKGNGNTLEQQDYHFEVKNPKNGISYYRLKQIDFDGQSEFSKVISVNFKGEIEEIGEFYPNPSKSGLVNLNYTTQNDKEIVVSVFDMTGKLMLNQIQQVGRGDNDLSFVFSDLNTGIFIVKIGDDINSVQRKLIIER